MKNPFKQSSCIISYKIILAHLKPNFSSISKFKPFLDLQERRSCAGHFWLKLTPQVNQLFFAAQDKQRHKCGEINDPFLHLAACSEKKNLIKRQLINLKHSHFLFLTERKEFVNLCAVLTVLGTRSTKTDHPNQYFYSSSGTDRAP